jgi:hypothetical protein
MTGRWRKLSGLTVIALCGVSAGCGTYGSSFVQGRGPDTPLEKGVGQRFQQLVPRGTTVQNVRCSASKQRAGADRCTIIMVRGKPARSYSYVVFAAHTSFHAYNSSGSNPVTTWAPPVIFIGGY